MLRLARVRPRSSIPSVESADALSTAHAARAAARSGARQQSERPAGGNRRRRTGLLPRLLAALLFSGAASPAAAFQPDTFDDYRDGDLVVQDRPGSREAAVWAATGSRYTHVGVVRLTGGGPYVLDLDASASEVPVEDFIARGAGPRYAVYRVSSSADDLGARAAAAAWRFTDRRRNLSLAPDRDTLYSSELVYRAYRAAGIALGRFQRLDHLHAGTSRLKSLMMAGWTSDPACRAAGTRYDLCWDKLRGERLVTVDSIVSDRRVTLIRSTFPDRR